MNRFTALTVGKWIMRDGIADGLIGRRMAIANLVPLKVACPSKACCVHPGQHRPAPLVLLVIDIGGLLCK
jgi:hypothetical protein